MFSTLKYFIASFVLFVVLCGIFNETSRNIVFADTIGGLLVGVLHGLLHYNCIIENNSALLTKRRAAKIMFLDVRIDTIVGLLIGTLKVILFLCF